MIPTARVFPIPHFIFKSGLVDSRLRASNEHIRIVRVARAQGSSQLPRTLFSSLLITGFWRRLAMFVATTVGQHLVRQRLPLFWRHEVFHSKTE